MILFNPGQQNHQEGCHRNQGEGPVRHAHQEDPCHGYQLRQEELYHQGKLHQNCREKGPRKILC